MIVPALVIAPLKVPFWSSSVPALSSVVAVVELLARTSGHRGAGRLRALLDRQAGATTKTRSPAEEVFLDLVRQARLPAPRVNARVAGYEVDFFWPEQKVIVEVDGYRFHSTRRAFEHDRRKDADLRAAGFTVLRVSSEQLERQPYAVIADVTRALIAPTQVATISAPSSREMATSTE